MTTFDETTKIWSGPKIPFPYPTNIHISEIILKSLKETPNRVLEIYDENGAQMTCEKLRLKATRIAQNLTKLGIKRGDVVGLNCSNSENISAVIHGCIYAGAIPSPMALVHEKSDLVHIWSQSEPKLIFCDAQVYAKVVDALSDMNNNATVCTLIERKDGVMFVDDVLATTGIEENFEPIKIENSEDSLISLASSSGTTGPAKLVCIRQSFLLRMVDKYQQPEVRFIHFAPNFWTVSFTFSVVLPLMKSTRIMTRRLASVETYVELIDKFKIELLHTNPILLSKILQSPLFVTANLSSLKYVSSSGALLHPDLRIKFKKMFPEIQLIVGYGATEIIFNGSLLTDENDGYTVGRPLPNCEVKIVDDDGNNVGVNERGEICAKTNFPFSGYYKRPEESENALDKDNFFKTGDIGYFDENGMLNVVDRKKDIFKYNFFHINPTEIENVIQQLDGVELVAVVGIPNQETINLACAVVIKRKGYEHLTKDDIIAYVADRLPAYKQLHGGVIFVEKFPTTPSDKVIRRSIAEFAEKEFKKLTSNDLN